MKTKQTITVPEHEETVDVTVCDVCGSTIKKGYLIHKEWGSLGECNWSGKQKDFDICSIDCVTKIIETELLEDNRTDIRSISIYKKRVLHGNR